MKSLNLISVQLEMRCVSGDIFHVNNMRTLGVHEYILHTFSRVCTHILVICTHATYKHVHTYMYT